jgi:hypothetical protein
MNDYHNLAVKAPLFAKYAVKGGALFEFACGRGGDLSRWVAGGFALVVGCDVSLDNLVNPRGGLYHRMLTSHAKLPPMAFVQMDCTVRMQQPLDEIHAVASESPHHELFAALWNLDAVIPPHLERFRGAVANGFDLTSCQFAVHYMFESDDALDRFVKNVAYTTRLGGHFIGTTFDGETSYNLNSAIAHATSSSVTATRATACRRSFTSPTCSGRTGRRVRCNQFMSSRADRKAPDSTLSRMHGNLSSRSRTWARRATRALSSCLSFSASAIASRAALSAGGFQRHGGDTGRSPRWQ